MINSQLGPVFPPDEPNLPASSLEASLSLLDDHTRGILEVDRARLTQSTAAAALLLTQTLELTPATASEVQVALINRASALSASYHQYFNQLISNAGISLAGQASQEDFRPRVFTVANIPQPVEQTDLTAAEDAEIDSIEPGEVLDDAVDKLMYDPSDILVLADDRKLLSSASSSKSIREFLNKVDADYAGMFNRLTSQELALVGCQIIDTYMQTQISGATPARKAVQKERIEKLFGLYEPAKPVGVVSEELGVTTVSIHAGINRVIESVGQILIDNGEHILRKAIVTAEFGDRDALFVSTTPVVPTNLPASNTSYLNGTYRSEATAVGNTESGSEHEATRVRYEHSVTPINMRNFLHGVFPHGYTERLDSLKPWQASMLTEELIQSYVSLSAATEEGKLRERILRLERWTGLYKPQQDYAEIALARVTESHAVKNQINSVIEKLCTKAPKEGLRELLTRVVTAERPTAQQLSPA